MQGKSKLKGILFSLQLVRKDLVRKQCTEPRTKADANDCAGNYDSTQIFQKQQPGSLL